MLTCRNKHQGPRHAEAGHTTKADGVVAQRQSDIWHGDSEGAADGSGVGQGDSDTGSAVDGVQGGADLRSSRNDG